MGFLAPNIIGFLAFTLVPLVLSMVLAFSNWDLSRHNMFKDASPEFRGFSNFVQFFGERDFWKYLGNTLFLMMGIPFSIAGSLLLAILLSKDLRGGNRRNWGYLMIAAVVVATVVMTFSVNALVAGGHIGSAFTVVLTGIACGLLVVGVSGGSTVYRTLFFVPHFVSGVSVFILWKHLYRPNIGPFTLALQGPLNGLSQWVNCTGQWVFIAGKYAMVALAAVLMGYGLNKLRRMYRDGGIGWFALIQPVGLILLPAVLAQWWFATVWVKAAGIAWPVSAAGTVLAAAAALWLAVQALLFRRKQDFPCESGEGLGTGLMLAAVVMIGQLVLIGLGMAWRYLPNAAAGPEGIEPPLWLQDVQWAKPSLMFMGLWASIGSNNMLLYLAGLSNVPQELYEAADTDGAGRFQKFWHVTWPQLAPTTFFIVVMSVIGGLQGGFEMVRTMTQGGPAGATTPLSYFIYTVGFESGRLGYASAVAWVLFLMIFVATLFNWRFGNRYVNE